MIFATFALPPGASLEHSDAVVTRAEQFLTTVPGVQNRASG